MKCYCYATKSYDDEYSETSIFDNIENFKKYYINLIIDNLDDSEISKTNYFFNLLDMLKYNFKYIHWIDEEEFIIVLKNNIVYMYDSYNMEIRKCDMDYYEVIDYKRNWKKSFLMEVE